MGAVPGGERRQPGSLLIRRICGLIGMFPTSLMTALSDFHKSFDDTPDEGTTCFAAADAIEMRGDVRREVLRASCRIHSVLGGVALPHRFPTFLRTESPGVDASGKS